MSQRIIPQPALSRALQRRLSMPAVDHGFDVVSDPPPAKRLQEPQEPRQDPNGADEAPRT
jgi:hypothetical protein